MRQRQVMPLTGCLSKALTSCHMHKWCGNGGVERRAEESLPTQASFQYITQDSIGPKSLRERPPPCEGSHGDFSLWVS
jgi:hypothetical protein